MDPVSDNTVGIIAIISIFVLGPITIAFARNIWKRGNEPREVRSPGNDELVRKMHELQTSMDAMALEVERISEGQRFITRVMSEKPAAELRTKN